MSSTNATLDELEPAFQEDEAIDNWLAVYGAAATDDPELNLFRAILADGIRQYLKTGSGVEEAWLHGRTGAFPYEYVCEVLEIVCPDRLREAVFALRLQGQRSLAPRLRRKVEVA